MKWLETETLTDVAMVTGVHVSILHRAFVSYSIPVSEQVLNRLACNKRKAIDAEALRTLLSEDKRIKWAKPNEKNSGKSLLRAERSAASSVITAKRLDAQR